MTKKMILLWILLGFSTQALSFTVNDPGQSIQEQIRALSDVKKISITVNSDVLPVPYNYLLLQPLMTLGIEHYYGRTPTIQTLYALKNQHENTYFRAIQMLIDKDKTRNNVQLALIKNEAMVVELAFITMNFNELPQNIIKDVLNTTVPFGKLLASNHIKTLVSDRTYFELTCDKVLASLTQCSLNSKIYGRTNTLINADNHQWLAHVVEILPGFLSE